MRRWLEGVVRALISALMYETFGPMRIMASFNLPWPHPQKSPHHSVTGRIKKGVGDAEHFAGVHRYHPQQHYCVCL